MKSDKELKQEFKKKFSKEFEKYYPIKVLKKLGYKRGKCTKCGKYYWATDKRQVCGDAACIGKYEFLERKITKVKLSYLEVWQEFSNLFRNLGYKAIKRYPVVARWRDDTLYVKASIYDFQPHVTSGISPPPAEKLVVPQTCLRFNDIDNVGVTMSHMTGFVMIGQHAFLPKEEWDQDKLFEDICKWLFDVLKIPLNEVVFHEDAWAGGGNLGPCMEFFSGGVELGNQVYMSYLMTKNGLEDLQLKVLDMGMGQERIAWFTQQSPTIYDATFPRVINKLQDVSGIKLDKKLLSKYVPYGAMLNFDEIDNVKENVAKIAKEIGLNPEKLEKFLAPTAALYSIAEHARSLLIALTDGSLPSNVGDAYNLRMLFRRAINLIEKHKFNVELSEVCKWHAKELRPMFPELYDNIKDVEKILAVEKKKYFAGREKAISLVKRLLASGEKLSAEKAVELYDSHGINPNDIEKIAEELKVKVELPKNFYQLVSKRHLKKEVKEVKKTEISLPDIEKPTKLLYYGSNRLVFTGKILAVFKHERDDVIVLDKTTFYPEGGGQDHDIGTLNGEEVFNVKKVQDYVLHFIKKSKLKVGEKVKGVVDKKRRLQLSIHHTATHILNAAARSVLGNHIYQAGAKKTIEKARLDITHFEALTQEELKLIEKKAQELIKKEIQVNKFFMDRAEAERRYGIRIYQGGYIPGKQIRIVSLGKFDVEACGGTHLDNTIDVGSIKIIKSSKIQDGVVRLEYVAGTAAKAHAKNCEAFSSVFGSMDETEKVARVFNVQLNATVSTVKRFTDEIINLGGKPNNVKNAVDAKKLFELWKTLKKQSHSATCEVPGEKKIVIVNAQVPAMINAITKVKKALLVNKQGFFVFKGTDEEFANFVKAGAKGGGREIKQGKFSGDVKKLKVF